MIDTATTIGKKYNIEKLLGHGKFGVVYKGRNIKTDEEVAIKMEKRDIEPIYKILKYETTILNHLSCNGCKNIPSVYWYGVYLEYTCLIMSYYSCNLQDYINKKTIDQSKLNMIMIKCIDILENIHKNWVLHRDIKPQNFMINDGDLYIIDFGLSTIYIDENNEHVKKIDSEHIIGTPKYVSYFTHCGDTVSRRNDLISLGYMYLYLNYRELPWENTSMIEQQNNVPETHLTHTKNIFRRREKKWENISKIAVDSIYNYFKYCYELEYDSKPNYYILKELFLC
jgi:serine/threonine protein kinase